MNLSIYENEISAYNTLNKYAQPGGTVLFGSTFIKEIPAAELSQSLSFRTPVYNRGITDLSVFDAGYILGSCVFDLMPDRMLMQLGETDLLRGYRSLQDIIYAYDSVIHTARTLDKHCSIVLVSVCCDTPHPLCSELNSRIRLLAKSNKCRYADISLCKAHMFPAIKAFSALRFFIQEPSAPEDVLL